MFGFFFPPLSHKLFSDFTSNLSPSPAFVSALCDFSCKLLKCKLPGRTLVTTLRRVVFTSATVLCSGCLGWQMAHGQASLSYQILLPSAEIPYCLFERYIGQCLELSFVEVPLAFHLRRDTVQLVTPWFFFRSQRCLSTLK